MRVQFSSRLENGIISWVRVHESNNIKDGFKDATYVSMVCNLVKLPSSIFIMVAAKSVVGTEWHNCLSRRGGHVMSTSNDIYELMERAARQYPGYMLGVPWANSFLVAFRGLFDMRMWGFWLALASLAWQAYSRWGS